MGALVPPRSVEGEKNCSKNTLCSGARKHGVLGVLLDLISIQNQGIHNLEVGLGMDQRLFNLERRVGFLDNAMIRAQHFYRDILRKQYIALFGNIRKYCDTRGYHNIFTISFYARYQPCLAFHGPVNNCNSSI